MVYSATYLALLTRHAPGTVYVVTRDSACVLKITLALLAIYFVIRIVIAAAMESAAL